MSPYGVVHSGLFQSGLPLMELVLLRLTTDRYAGSAAHSDPQDSCCSVSWWPWFISLPAASGEIRSEQCWELGTNSSFMLPPVSQAHHNTVFALHPALPFSSHHHPIRIFTCQVKEKSRQRTEPTSHYVHIWLSAE